MRYAILSDIHGNLHALDAVMQSVQRELVDHVVCLGDIVGYGPDPLSCVRAVMKHSCTVVAGNHDCAVVNKIDVRTFNVFARESTFWTRDALDEECAAYLTELPLVSELDGFTAVHGSLHAPELFDYVQSSYDAYLSMQMMQQPLCFIGHSHVPVTYTRSGQGPVVYSRGERVSVSDQQKTIVNVGSVGQPRDFNPRASYALYDAQKREVEIRRVCYDVDGVAAKIIEAGLPRPLAERLHIGR